MFRRVFLSATGAALAAPSIVPARAAPIELKWGTALPATHPVALRCREALDAVRRDTNGDVRIELFPDSQLGGDSDMLTQVRSGALEFLTSAGVSLATFVREAGIINMPFAFNDYAQVWPAMDGEFGAAVRAAIARSGLHVFDRLWDNGFRQVTTSVRAVHGPSDLRGLKMRVPASPLNTALFRALGAAPSVLNVSEVYSALQTHVVDGQENPLAQVSLFKFFEVQRFCALTDHVWDGFIMLANGPTWNGLPAEVRSVITRHVDAAALLQRQDVAALNATLRKELEVRGMQFTQPDKQPFRDLLRTARFYDEWRSRYGDVLWSLLGKYSEHLT